ncbi:hypothetical protein D5086_008763 [Populus alba]|uniref:Uncharacterized protein n=1 Tax=Populus alba TaxID=43335 RepID=A0ACC4CHY0_POPAL
MSKTEENTEKKILNKKLKDVEISLPIVYGNIAFWLGKKANEYQSHKWTVYKLVTWPDDFVTRHSVCHLEYISKMNCCKIMER